MNELAFQKELVDAAIKVGGHALKANNRFLVGVADLSVKLKEFPHVYLECKKHNTLKGTQNTGLTPHQRKFLREYRESGGVSGWVTFAPVKGKRDWYEIYVSLEVNAVRIAFDNPAQYGFTRRRGEPWPIEGIVRTVVKGHGVHKSYSSS